MQELVKQRIKYLVEHGRPLGERCPCKWWLVAQTIAIFVLAGCHLIH